VKNLHVLDTGYYNELQQLSIATEASSDNSGPGTAMTEPFFPTNHRSMIAEVPSAATSETLIEPPAAGVHQAGRRWSRRTGRCVELSRTQRE